MNEKLRWTVRILSFLFTAAVCAAAVLYSGHTGEKSKADSTAVTGAVAPSVIKNYEEMDDSQRTVSQAVLNSKIRKIAHCFEYMAIGAGSSVFALTFLRTAEPSPEKKGKRRPSGELLCFLALLYSLLFAAADEIHQSFIPGRAGMIEDAALDFFAASVSVLIVWGISRAARKNAPAGRAQTQPARKNE